MRCKNLEMKGDWKSCWKISCERQGNKIVSFLSLETINAAEMINRDTMEQIESQMWISTQITEFKVKNESD